MKEVARIIRVEIWSQSKDSKDSKGDRFHFQSKTVQNSYFYAELFPELFQPIVFAFLTY